MKLAFYDPKPTRNDYVEKMWFAPLMQYAIHRGIPVKEIDNPIPEFGWTMLCNAGHLNRDLIRHFHANKCPLVAVSCNDSAYLTEQLNNPDLWLIPLVFTISGVQKVNFSQQSVMGSKQAFDMNVTTREVRFLPDEAWEIYDQMRREGRILPLPYVPWDRLEEVPIPVVKTPKILFRGGNHFWRFVAYLHALANGMAHPASGFLTADYYSPDMVPQFRFCQKCRNEYRANGNRMSFWSATERCDCMPDKKSFVDEPLKWNNRCPRAFFGMACIWFGDGRAADLAPAIEEALNFKRQSPREHLMAIADAESFADCKWEFSIHMAQRFWEAASVNTVNWLPERVNDQEHFPFVEDGKHYMTFANDFSMPVDKEYDPSTIAANARALYEHWIKPGPNYVTNENLLHHILNRIGEVSV